MWTDMTVGPGARVMHGLHGIHRLLVSWATALVVSGSVASVAAFAAEPPTIPSAASVTAAPRCTVGQPCTFAAPIFACDYASAEKIAATEPTQATDVGVGMVREQTCQTVPAGRSLQTEATQSPKVVYLTESGQHLGYMPVGVFASSGTGPRAACDQPGFCAVRPGAQVWLCPQAAALALPTPEVKSGARCLRISDSNAGEVTLVDDSTVMFANMFGGKPPYASSYYAAKSDFVRLTLTSRPTPVARGWCRPEAWCVTAATALFCTDRTAPARIEAAPPGEPRRLAVQAEPGCRFVVGGGVLKPTGMPEAGDPQKLVAVEHPTLGPGWANASAFGRLSSEVPVRQIAQLSDLTISLGKGPLHAAVVLSGQGTSAAEGVFRAGPRERHAACLLDHDDERSEGFRVCMVGPDTTVRATANCEARRLTFTTERYGLFHPPPDPATGQPINPDREWVYRDLASGEWLDGRSISGEMSVGSTFQALCPGADPDASEGLVYRDPTAVYPPALQSVWAASAAVCEQMRRAKDGEPIEGALTIRDSSAQGYEYHEDLNQLRRLDPQRWTADVSWSGEGEGGQASVSYRLINGTLLVTNGKATQRLTRCR